MSTNKQTHNNLRYALTVQSRSTHSVELESPILLQLYLYIVSVCRGRDLAWGLSILVSIVVLFLV